MNSSHITVIIWPGLKVLTIVDRFSPVTPQGACLSGGLLPGCRGLGESSWMCALATPGTSGHPSPSTRIRILNFMTSSVGKEGAGRERVLYINPIFALNPRPAGAPSPAGLTAPSERP